MDNKVRLHGRWTSPYAKRVELSLTLKGIEYEYFEEDLLNNSPSLLKYNPVYKKVPVLVHIMRPVSESAIFSSTSMRPGRMALVSCQKIPTKDPGFNFGPSSSTNRTTVDQASVRDARGFKLKVLGEGIKDMFPAGRSLVNGETLGLLDIGMCSVFGSHKIQEEVTGEVLIDPEKYPEISSWLTTISEQPAAKALASPRE